MTGTAHLNWSSRLDALCWPTQTKDGLGGYAVPCFVNNLGFHLTTANAFSDGSIDIWGTVDRQIFQRKVGSGRVWMAPSTGARLYVHNLGCLTIRMPDWRFDNVSILPLVDAAICSGNPNLADLVNLAGDETEPIPGAHQKARRYKLPLRRPHPIRITSEGVCHKATAFPVIMIEGAVKRLTRWFVFDDSLTRFGLDGPLIHLDEAARRLAIGEITTSAEEGDRLDIDGLGVVTVEAGLWGIDPAERVREARGEVEVLNGGQGSIRQCMEAFRAYQRDPLERNLDVLRQAYEAVPSHLRGYCGDMDQRDLPIRRALGLA